MRNVAGKIMLALIFVAVAALAQSPALCSGSITSQAWGTTQSGQPVRLYTLKNANGVTVKITNYGGIVQSILVPDRSGHFGDVVLGFNNVGQYEKSSPYFGALIGRYANRIAKGVFTLDGKTYHLAINNAPNCLHGGKIGFDKKVWSATMARHAAQLTLRYVSKNGEENFPGTLKAKVVYTLADNNSLKIDYTATTDNDTVVNLTNHAYYNLNGEGNGTVLDHQVQIWARRYTPIDKALIPTGQLAPVRHTPFDFLRPTAIGARIDTTNQQLVFAGGYDHNFVLDHPANVLSMVARVTSAKTGRVLTVFTTQPGIQLYTGNFLDGTLVGKSGKKYLHRGAFCLETQHFPDTPNRPSFPTTELKPGQVYRQTSIYRFSTLR